MNIRLTLRSKYSIWYNDLWPYAVMDETDITCMIYRPALCAGLIPMPSFVIIALVAGGTLNCKIYNIRTFSTYFL